VFFLLMQYSGGQKSPTPQGGYYASAHPKNYHPHRPEMIAMESDITIVTQVMEELQLLEALLESRDSTIENSLSTKGSIKKLVTSHPFVDSLSRLECVRGEPIWGLSMYEREMVSEARNKVNQS
jgi:hypothetical protein